MKKRLIAVAMILVLAIGLPSLGMITGANLQTVSAKNKIKAKSAKKLVKNYIKYAKSYKWGKMNKCFKNKKCERGYPTKSPLPQLYKSFNKNLKYKITGVVSNGNKCTVKTYVWIPNLGNEISDALIRAYLDVYYGLSDDFEESNFDYYIYNLKNAKGSLKKTKVLFNIVKTKKGLKIKKKTLRMVDIATGFFATEANKTIKYLNNENDY